MGPFLAIISTDSAADDSNGDLVRLVKRPKRLADLVDPALIGLGSLYGLLLLMPVSTEVAAWILCSTGVDFCVRAGAKLGEGIREGLADIDEAFEGERSKEDMLE